jgi:hypothetical protein
MQGIKDKVVVIPSMQWTFALAGSRPPWQPPEKKKDERGGLGGTAEDAEERPSSAASAQPLRPPRSLVLMKASFLDD